MATHTVNQYRRNPCSWTILFIFFFFPTMCFIFWKCPYGFGNIDESFYLTIPYRFIQGDAMFLEEWHLSQMAGILTMPIVSAYLKWNGSTEGILLAMRYVFTFIQCICAVFLYARLKHINPIGAIIASISFLLYTPFGIMALSYNSMGIMLLTLSLVIILTAQKHQQLQYCFSGFLFAAAVLCCPFLLAVYVIYLVAVIIIFFLQRRKIAIIQEPFLSIKNAVFFSSGAACAAVLFSVFVLTRGSLSDIILAFKPMFNDPEHPRMSIAFKTKLFILYTFLANDWTPLIYSLLAVLGLVCLWVRKHPQHKLLVACIIAVVILVLQYSFFHLNNYINHLMWSANVFAGFIFLLTTNPKIYRLFFTVWIPGMFYSYCLNITSNQLFFAISSASSVATVASIVIICLFAEELSQVKESFPHGGIAIALICLFLGMQLYTQAVLRYELTFWDSTPNNLTFKITDGVEKGIYTTESKHDLYYEKLDHLDQLSDYSDKNVLYLSEYTWYYLQNENQLSTYSAWLSGINSHSIDRLETYYQINPHKLPDAVFADEQNEECAILFSQRFQYTCQKINGGYLLLPK